METNIVTYNQKDAWNAFIVENNGSFLQSFEWSEFQELAGNKVFLIRVGEGSEILAQALVINQKLRFGLKSYFYIPYGPCLKKKSQGQPLTLDGGVIDAFFVKIKELAKKQGVIFLRVEPQRNFEILKFQNFNISAIRLQPQKTLLLDLKPQEDEILQSLHKDTRYSIRTANKKGVTIEFKDEYSPEFYKLLMKTAGNAKFRPHTEGHYKIFFDVSNESFKVKMCLAKYEGNIIAASIMIIFAKRATYLHASSDKSFSALQAPSFLIWEQMKLAKNIGCEVFDLWGIDEKKWPGVTKFKKSFGGREVEYPESCDIIFSKLLYKAYRLVKK